MTAPEPDPNTDRAADAPETMDPESPGLAATKPLDDPSRSDVEPNEPA